MNAITQIASQERTEPTVKERLRYVDITFDAAKEAYERLVKSGEIERFAPASQRQGKVGKLAMRIVAQQVREEGLHPGVLSPSARKAYDTIIQEECDEQALIARVSPTLTDVLLPVSRGV